MSYSVGSSFPSENALIETFSGRGLQRSQDNALLMQRHQQEIDATGTEMIARAAAGLSAIGAPGAAGEAERAAAYPGAVASLPPSLRARAPAQYPGWQALKQYEALGTPAEAAADRAANKAGIDQLLGGGTTPGPGASAAPAAGAGAGQALASIHPDLTQITSKGGTPLTVAAGAAPKFQGLIDDLEAAGYKLDPATTGGYNARNIAGTNTPSQHAYGAAIDINSSRNARGANTPSDIPPDLARSLAAKHGLTWGGDWTGDTRDPMHFEVAGAGTSAGGGGVAARTGGTDFAGPGAPTPGAAPAGGSGPLAGLTQDQVMTLRAYGASPKATTAGVADRIAHFKEHNAALAHQRFEDQRQLEQDALALRNEARANRGEEATAEERAMTRRRQAEQDALSPYMRDPNSDDPSKVVFRPGGSADPATAAALAKARGEGGKTIHVADRSKLISTAGSADEMGTIKNTFGDYGGYGSAWTGNMANFAALHFGVGDVDASEWWQRYQKQKIAARQMVSGQTLTPMEYSEFEKADINPGMTNKSIRDNLKRQDDIITHARDRLVRTLAAEGYNPAAIEEASGVSLEDAQRRMTKDIIQENTAAPKAGGRPPLSSFQR